MESNLQHNEEDDEWEIEEENFYRIKIDQCKSLKTKQYNDFKLKLKSKKIKKLEPEQKKNLELFKNYLDEQIFPTLNFPLSESLHHVSIKNYLYDSAIKPEIGTNLFFKIEEKNVQYLGKSENYIEMIKKTPLSSVKEVSRENHDFPKKISMPKRKISKKKPKKRGLNKVIEMTEKIDENFKKPQNVVIKRRRKKKLYKKNSTIKHFVKVENNK